MPDLISNEPLTNIILMWTHVNYAIALRLLPSMNLKVHVTDV